MPETKPITPEALEKLEPDLSHWEKAARIEAAAGPKSITCMLDYIAALRALIREQAQRIAELEAGA